MKNIGVYAVVRKIRITAKEGLPKINDNISAKEKEKKRRELKAKIKELENKT